MVKLNWEQIEYYYTKNSCIHFVDRINKASKTKIRKTEFLKHELSQLCLELGKRYGYTEYKAVISIKKTTKISVYVHQENTIYSIELY